MNNHVFLYIEGQYFVVPDPKSITAGQLIDLFGFNQARKVFQALITGDNNGRS